MDVGKTILNAIVHRIPRSMANHNGVPVTIYTNHQSSVDEAPAKMPPELLWGTQPHLRTVVDFICRNVAQLGLHTFERSGEDRVRSRDSVIAALLRQPNPYMTTYELVYDLVGNLALHDRAYWFVYPNRDGAYEIQPFPAPWVSAEYDHLWKPVKYVVAPPNTEGRKVEFSADQVLAFDNWSPIPGAHSSPVDTLRLVLEEQYHSRKHRVQLWRRSGRVGAYISRPVDAPTWTNTDRQRFYKMFESFTGDGGSRAGGVPLMEEGMELKSYLFNSADQEWATSIKLSLETVAQVYQVNPTMIGILDNANYSNVKEFNKSLYTNTLGPLIRMIELRLNTFLLPMLGVDPEKFFVEFNINEKLRGSFEEQAAVASSAVGAPYMTRNEMRKLNNLPALDGADDLVTPLNLSQTTVAEDPPDTPDSTLELTQSEKAVFASHDQRVERVYKASKRFDLERFTRELEEDLRRKGGRPGLARLHNEHLATQLGVGTD